VFNLVRFGSFALSDMPFLGVVPDDISRTNILGVGVSATNMHEALNETEMLLRRGSQGYICVTGVHGVMEAQKDRSFRSILNDSFLTTPDGMPLVWLGKFAGFKKMDRVYGPDFMLGLCGRSKGREYTHFLYGGNVGVAEKLKNVLERKIPGLKIVGTYTPPFRPLNPTEEAELETLIATSKPDILWVGLSTPKQERFMAEHMGKLDVKLMVGVGAAFDIHTGGIRDAPRWMKRSGLQWFHRLGQEPDRLWKRYLINNPSFVWKILLQLTGIRRTEIE
jgi:N-acetylglucosaminyldiphosphoundecaprenol N-acetyl-beta-D-mannosaminyltransferase